MTMKIFAYLICFSLLAITSECADKIGEVVAVDGVLKAEGVDHNQRILTKNSDVLLGDTLITEATSKGQIQFTDGTLVLLIPDSRYSVQSYTSSHLIEKNQYLARLYEGGVRILTGLIAKKNPENFEVATPNATIGVRGTLFEARLFQGDVFAGSSSGQLSLRNQAGSLNIGSNMPNQFAAVNSMDSPPAGLSQRPPELNLALFNPPIGGIPFGVTAAQTNVGSAAAAGRAASLNDFAWTPAIISVTALGIMAGVIISNANTKTSKQTFSH